MTQDKPTIEDVLKKHLGEINLFLFKKEQPFDYKVIVAAMTEWASLQTPSNEKYSRADVENIISMVCDQFGAGFAGRREFIEKTIEEYSKKSTPIPILTPCVELEKEVERLKGLIEAAKLALKEIYTGTDFPLSIAQNALQLLNL